MSAMTEEGSIDSSRSPESIVRIAARVVGVLIILAGGYYAILVLESGIRICRDPSEVATAVTAWNKLLKLEEATVAAGATKIAVGPSAASGMVYAWYFLTGSIALALIGAGGKLVLGSSAQREELLAALKELVQRLRPEDRPPTPRGGHDRER
jgi:hypothetical protein